jgi:hypothetical protein
LPLFVSSDNRPLTRRQPPLDRLRTAERGYWTIVLFRAIVLSLLALSLVSCGGAHLDAKVAKRLAVAKASKDPAYWLGRRYDGLNLVYVESGSEAFFTSSLYYADCSWFDMNTLSPHCHRVVEVDNDVPAQGEISSMGRCIFATTVRGVTVATFPVNPNDLRVFARGATVLVSGQSRRDSLKAIAALKPLNGRPLLHRDVSSMLGSCKAPPPKPAEHLTAKQRYEQRMKHSFFIASTGGINLNAVEPLAAKPRVVLDEFLSDTATEPALLRNEARRIEQIHPPAAVSSQHARLVAALRSYADILDDVRADARRDGLDEQAWARDRATLEPRIAGAAAAIARTVKAFQALRYSIFVRPTD